MKYRKTLVATAVASMIAIAGSAFAGDKMHSGASFSVTEELSTDGGPYQRVGTGDFRKEP